MPRNICIVYWYCENVWQSLLRGCLSEGNPFCFGSINQRRNVIQRLTNNSNTNILLEIPIFGSDFQKYNESRWQFQEKLLSMNRLRFDFYMSSKEATPPGLLNNQVNFCGTTLNCGTVRFTPVRPKRKKMFVSCNPILFLLKKYLP